MAIDRLGLDSPVVGASGAEGEARDLSLPPHNLDAEEAVLGSVLKSPQSIVRVSDFLRAEDFYAPRHKHIYQAMLSLASQPRPIDYHTVADELQQLGLYEAAGGLLYLSELNVATPTSAHIEFYGHVVERTAIMRRLISASQTIAEIAYRDNLDPDTALEKAEQLILSIAERRVTRDFRSLEDVLHEYMEQVEAITEGEGARYGIPSGYTDLDKLLGGFQRTDLIILAARTSVGKALAVDTPIPTPNGWQTMGDLRVGDQVFDERGRPTCVTFVTPVQLERECFEVVFSDGQRIVADADHRWSVLTRTARRAARPTQTVLTTREMVDSLRTASGHLNYSVPLAAPLEYDARALPVDPYVLGIWLGDGTTTSPTVTVGDAELVDQLTAAGCEVRPRQTRGTPQFAIGPWVGRGRRTPGNAKLTHLRARGIRARLNAGELGKPLAAEYGVSRAAISLVNTSTTWRGRPASGMHEALSGLGLIGHKHVPRMYLHASIQQRTALLQGLMDSDGCIGLLGYAEFCSTSRELADGVFELAAGLGMAPRSKVSRARLNGVDCRPRYRVTFLPLDFDVFRLTRKRSRQRVVSARARARQRFITAINAVASVPVRCIQVDSLNHLYLAGRACVPTHNTSFALNLAVNASMKAKATVAVFSLEMAAEQLASRLLSMESGVDSPRIRSGQLNDQETRKVDHALNFLVQAPIWVDDTPSIPIMELRSKARRLAAEQGVDLIVVDYLQLIAAERGENRVQELGQVSRALKALARELRVPIIALSQLSRAVEQRSPHIPQLSDLRESGSIEQDADVVLFIYRDEKYNPDTDKKGVADIIVAKHRNGPTGQVQLLFLERTTKFLDLEVFRA
ncbi:MAG: replicative DNA helicase [Chloroflexi bacterium]|nr:replicative DNA helicase [Chloroflexota bacterium]